MALSGEDTLLIGFDLRKPRYGYGGYYEEESTVDTKKRRAAKSMGRS